MVKEIATVPFHFRNINFRGRHKSNFTHLKSSPACSEFDVHFDGYFVPTGLLNSVRKQLTCCQRTDWNYKNEMIHSSFLHQSKWWRLGPISAGYGTLKDQSNLERKQTQVQDDRNLVECYSIDDRAWSWFWNKLYKTQSNLMNPYKTILIKFEFNSVFFNDHMTIFPVSISIDLWMRICQNLIKIK